MTALPGWAGDAVAEALPALRRSCAAWGVMQPDAELGGSGAGSLAGDWAPACRALAALPPQPSPLPHLRRRRMEWLARLRHTLEANFIATDQGVGTMTGYFEPQLRGSREPTEHHTVPLLAMPDGPRPLPSRAAIDQGALAGQGLELVWVDSYVDAFFLHIQGSGRVLLPDGALLRIGYAGQNGHPYHAIGRVLIQRGEIARESMSMQALQAWLRRAPFQDAAAVMRANASYVFFRVVQGLTPEDGPIGAMGVSLTPMRSIAVDRAHVPMGAPVFLAAPLAPQEPAPSLPAARSRRGAPPAPRQVEPVPRLGVALDVGGAMRGRARADFFWGWDDEAANRAGRTYQPTRMFVLSPRDVGPSVR